MASVIGAAIAVLIVKYIEQWKAAGVAARDALIDVVETCVALENTLVHLLHDQKAAIKSSADIEKQSYEPRWDVSPLAISFDTIIKCDDERTHRLAAQFIDRIAHLKKHDEGFWASYHWLLEHPRGWAWLPARARHSEFEYARKQMLRHCTRSLRIGYELADLLFQKAQSHSLATLSRSIIDQALLDNCGMRGDTLALRAAYYSIRDPHPDRFDPKETYRVCLWPDQSASRQPRVFLLLQVDWPGLDAPVDVQVPPCVHIALPMRAVVKSARIVRNGEPDRSGSPINRAVRDLPAHFDDIGELWPSL